MFLLAGTYIPTKVVLCIGAVRAVKSALV